MKRFVSGAVLLIGMGIFASCAQTGSQVTSGGPSAAQAGDGWIMLFDGRTLNGWTNRGVADWKVVDGTLSPTPGSGQGHLTTNQSYGNYQLQLEFYTDTIANSGVYLRVPPDSAATIDNSSEVQIYDNGPVWQTGAIVNVQAALEKVVTAGKWSTMDITANGPRLVVLVDGRKIADADVGAPPRRMSGPIILGPGGRGEVRFRNIRIRPL